MIKIFDKLLDYMMTVKNEMGGDIISLKQGI